MNENLILSNAKLLTIIFNEIISTEEIRVPFIYDLKKSENNVTVPESNSDVMSLKPLMVGITKHEKNGTHVKKSAVHRQVLPYTESKKALTNKTHAVFLFSNAFNSALIGLTEVLGSDVLKNNCNKIRVTFSDCENFAGYEMRTALISKEDYLEKTE